MQNNVALKMIEILICNNLVWKSGFCIETIFYFYFKDNHSLFNNVTIYDLIHSVLLCKIHSKL